MNTKMTEETVLKFYVGDVVTIPPLSTRYYVTSGVLDSDNHVELDNGNCFQEPQCLTLVRRSDEPAWPADLPPCELPLPVGTTRWAYRGGGFKTTSKCCGYYTPKIGWQRIAHVGTGITGVRYVEAVNDAYYTPPTDSYEVHSKLHLEQPAKPSSDVRRTAVTTFEHGDARGTTVVLRGAGVELEGYDAGYLFTAQEARAVATLLLAAAEEIPNTAEA